MAIWRSKENNAVSVIIITGLLSWLVPGGGYYFLKEKKRGIIIFVTITLTFLAGLYVGSIGVIDPIGSWPWYIAQVMNSPAVFAIGHKTAGGGFEVYGRPNEIGQIYTSIAGLLNLLCIVNAVYFAYTGKIEGETI
jgi:hypothetical protein